MRVWYIKSQARLAEVLGMLGEFAEGRRHGEEALRLAMIDGQWQRDAPIYARARLGSLYHAQGDLEAAIRVCEEGLALCRVSGNRGPRWALMGSLGEAYAYTGRLAEGLALLEQARAELTTAIELYRAMEMTFWLPQAEAALTQISG
jgi:tetratricopeptide (TPR) repeat protein